MLCSPKFAFSEEKSQIILKMTQNFGLEVNPSPAGENLPDMDDLVFYEIVLEKRDDDAYLITGNMKYFPSREYIVTPDL